MEANESFDNVCYKEYKILYIYRVYDEFYKFYAKMYEKFFSSMKEYELEIMSLETYKKKYKKDDINVFPKFILIKNNEIIFERYGFIHPQRIFDEFKKKLDKI